MTTSFHWRKPACTAFLFLSAILFAHAQNKMGFEVKERKDTTLDKSKLKARVIQGNNSSSSSPFFAPSAFGNLSLSISPSFARLPKKNARVDNAAEIILSKESGLPIFISTPKKSANTRTDGSYDKVSSAFAYLDELSPLLKGPKPSEQFKIKSYQTDLQGNSHVRFAQHYKGIKFYDGEIIAHLNGNGDGEILNGKYYVLPKDIETQPVISKEEAISKTVAHLSSKTKYRTLSDEQKKWLEYEGPKVDTVIYEDKSLVTSYLLAYEISIRPNIFEEWHYVIDAKAGTVLNFYKNTCHVDGPATTSALDLNNVTRTVNSYLTGSTYSLEDASRPMYNAADQTGVIKTLDANFMSASNFQYKDITSTNNTWSATAVSAHYNASVAYEYYRTVHGRNSIDGKGGDIVSFINVVDDDGTALDNAFWNNKFMFYGNGHVAFKPLAGGLDVGGHEMTHGVVQNTAALRYQGESGAINESMADIFGCSIDSADWLIGEDVVKIAYFPTGALRSLEDPHNGGTSLDDNGYQPRVKSEMYTGLQDNGGVHINSGIPNWAFYKYAQAVGRYHASKIFYYALTNFLTQSSQFIDLRLAVIQSAKALYGDNSKEANQAGVAFDAVGILDGTASQPTTSLPPNPGDEYILFYDTDKHNPNGLYRENTSSPTVDPLLKKVLYHKPSITDDGKMAVYIGTDNVMYGLTIDPSASSSTPFVIDENPVWANVAISKDGSKLAAVTLDQDTSIYIYDILSDRLVRYPLYNPTYTQGIKSGGPVYADALEWDYTGENLVYDAFNSIQGPSGETIEYWDINFLNVWNNDSSDFGDGTISKLFSDLDVGESIGNPTYSKNSPSILAFDYVNELDTLFGIVGLDLEHNTLDAISVNYGLGWPSYSKDDDMIAFTVPYDVNAYNVYGIGLDSTKITGSGDPYLLLNDAKWLVFYSLGVRDTDPTGLEDTDIATAPISVYPNPSTGIVYLGGPFVGKDDLTVDVYDVVGTKVSTQHLGYQTNQVDLSTLATGVYTLSLKNKIGARQVKVVKQ